MHPITSTYTGIISEMPLYLREKAHTLPYDIGISDTQSGGWEDFSNNGPMYDLPLYVLKTDDGVSSEVLALYRKAHHCAGFFGLLSDRIADGQVMDSEILSQYQDFFKLCWIGYLSDATGKPANKIEARVESAILAWKKGIRLERSYFRPRALETEIYAQAIIQKTHWLALTSICFLEYAGYEEQVQDFQFLWDMLICGMQCRDDAVDFNEDKKLNGVSYPEALGMTPGSLYRCGCELLKQSYLISKKNKYTKLSKWLDKHCKTHFKFEFTEYPELDAFGGWIFSSEISDMIRKIHERSGALDILHQFSFTSDIQTDPIVVT